MFFITEDTLATTLQKSKERLHVSMKVVKKTQQRQLEIKKKALVLFRENVRGNKHLIIQNK